MNRAAPGLHTSRAPIAALAALVALSVGCIGRPKTPDAILELERDPAAFLRRVSELRGLPELRPTPILFQDEAAFLSALDSGGNASATASDYKSVYSAFGFELPSARKGTSPSQVQHEQVIAFYDQDRHSVHVRRSAGSFKGTPLELKGVVAHELGHSLQYQHFKPPNVAEMTDLDQRLAGMALIEGDAMLTMLAFLADELHINLNRALVNAGKRAHAADTERYAAATSSSDALMRSPGLMRQRMMFPYMRGTTFLTAIHRSGGFPLVNRVYAAPPSTTEQVLHPEKYLVGEPAIPVQIPSVPAGWEVGLAGRMGELQTRVILENCLPADEAAAAAAGWGGDQFMLLERSSLSLVWLSAWDTVADAEQFELAAGKLARCWAAQPGGSMTSGVGRGELVRRSENVVVLVRGMAPVEREQVANSLVGQRFALTPAAPPLGQVGLVPIPTEPTTRPPFISPTAYVNERLGISLPMPPDFRAELDEGYLSLTRNDGLASMGVSFDERQVSNRSLTQVYDEFVNEVERDRHIRLELEQNSSTPTPLGAGVARSWVVRGTTLRVKLVSLPVCNSTGSIIFSYSWVDPHGLKMAEWWLGGLRSLSTAPPPVCAYLNP